MRPEDFVEALYRICFGRSADPSGLTHWAEVMRSTGDPTFVLKGILDSPEYVAGSSSASIRVSSACEFNPDLSYIDRSLRIVDVGAQSLGIGSHPYAPLLKLPGVEIIGFDPLADRLRERAENEPSPGLTLLPYALGDGRTHTLYINNDDGTSSLFPLNQSHNACFNHLDTLHTVRTEEVTTHRLDDVLPDGPVDFLKLDAQGAEFMILQAAERTLSQTAVVHCEVEFSPIYAGQPLFCSVYEYLMSRDFELIDLLIPGRYHYVTPSRRAAQDRLLWADAVFFRKTDDPAMLRVQTVIAASVYRKPSLAEYLSWRARRTRPFQAREP
jgi:FkbM family methyltransferase